MSKDILPILASLCSISAYITLGRKKWWGWLFSMACLIPLELMNFKYGFTAFHFLNLFNFCVFVRNARQWYLDGKKS